MDKEIRAVILRGKDDSIYQEVSKGLNSIEITFNSNKFKEITLHIEEDKYLVIKDEDFEVLSKFNILKKGEKWQ